MCPVSTGQRAGNRAASVPPGAPLDLEVPHVGAERRDLEERDESCPVNTGEGTSRVCLVREKRRGVSAGYEERPGGRRPWATRSGTPASRRLPCTARPPRRRV